MAETKQAPWKQGEYVLVDEHKLPIIMARRPAELIAMEVDEAIYRIMYPWYEGGEAANDG